MGSVDAKFKTPKQGKRLGQFLDERLKIGQKEFEKKYRPRIMATRKLEKKKLKKIEDETLQYTLGKKTLLGS